MTFDSSLSQDAEVMVAVSQTLRTSVTYSTVIERLQLLILSRTKPSGSKEDFTALLKNYRLRLMLGTFVPLDICCCTCSAEPNRFRY